MNREIIVIGVDHHNTLAVLRSLGEKGVKSLLVLISNNPKPYVAYCKYIEEKRIISTDEEILSAMLSLHRAKERAIVIACSDSISSFLDLNRDSLSKDFILPGSEKEGEITRLMNKDTMMNVAIESGLHVPHSWIIYPSNPDFEGLKYPCIIKPLISKSGSKSEIEVCTHEKELMAYLKNSHSEALQIQEYIKKNIEFQLIGCSLNSGNEVIIPGASIIIRQPQNTNTGFLRYVPIRDFSYDKNSCFEFIRKTGYSGLFSLEFLRDKDGKDYFMEINFRNDGNSICVTASGMNLPYIWYLYNSNLSYENELSYDSMKEVYVMPEFNDIGNALHHKISWCKWIKDVLITDRFMEFSRKDQKPFWMFVLKRLFVIK